MTSQILLYHDAKDMYQILHMKCNMSSCDQRLKETSNENPVLPYYGKYPNAVAGANVLKALN